jgi:Mce-associated membrane protein
VGLDKQAGTPTEDAGSTDGGWWGSTASIAMLGGALVLLLLLTGLGLAGLLGNRGVPEIREASQVQEAEETAPSVAEQAAKTILAYDYKTLDADQDAAERFMTQQFAEKYSDSFTKAVAPAARTFKAQVTSEVLGTSVVRATPDRVRVLAFVDQTTVATNKKNPQVALNRVEFDMVKRGGTWLVDDITSY